MKDDFQGWLARHEMNFEQFESQRWALHRANQEVSITSYRCRLLHGFGKQVSRKTLVYLDLKYWINMRDVLLGRKTEQGYEKLYLLLTVAVKEGRILCPLSFWIFQELLKQSCSDSRRATARLIDFLSDGVAFMHHGEIVSQELVGWIRRHSSVSVHAGYKSWPIRECIWTRTASFLGDAIPTWPETGIPEKYQLLVQKVMEDYNFFMPFEHIVAKLACLPKEIAFKSYDIDDFNRRKQAVRQNHSSFKKLFLAELMHTIKENERHWFESAAYLSSLITGVEEEVDMDRIPETVKVGARNLLWKYFESGKHSNDLPSYHVPAALYADISWNAARMLKHTDVFDFYHAQLAVPYCDVFLTEKSLRATCLSSHLRLDKIYNTTIIADPAEAVLYFEKHAQDNPSSSRVVRGLFASDTYEQSL
jgi:hypothetical protein